MLEKWGVQLNRTLRHDGRQTLLQLRTQSLELGLLKNAAGSARFHMGLTRVTAAVHGPIENRQKDEEIHGFVELQVRSIGGPKKSEERHLEAQLAPLLNSIIAGERFMHSHVAVIVQVENADGSVLTCATNAAICALLDAVIPCKYFCLAITAARAADGSLTLDPTAVEMAADFVHCGTAYSYCVEVRTGALMHCAPEPGQVQSNVTAALEYLDADRTANVELPENNPGEMRQWGAILAALEATRASVTAVEALIRKEISAKCSREIIKVLRLCGTSDDVSFEANAT